MPLGVEVLAGFGRDMTVGVTGAGGFLGWHIRARLHLSGFGTVGATRETFASEALMDEFVSKSDVIVHVAGVNRASSDDDIIEGNNWLADRLLDAMSRTNREIPVAYTNSTQSLSGGVYGESKLAAANQLREHQSRTGAPFLDLVLPHIFGEFGKPDYNSVTTTFAHALAVGQSPEVNREGRLELLHAQAVAERVFEFAGDPYDASEQLRGHPTTVGETWDLLQSMHQRYVSEFTVPEFANRFELQVFNTLRSQMYLNGFYPRSLTVHSDDRGAFAELCRCDGVGQSSFSTSAPGITRGDHLHLDKVERFVVLEGSATIRLRRILTDEMVAVEVTGEQPVFIDMPPLTTHSITNTGDSVLTTFFWAGDHFDAAMPDTYSEPVESPALVEGSS